jgi:hypothetical protein
MPSLTFTVTAANSFTPTETQAVPPLLPIFGVEINSLRELNLASQAGISWIRLNGIQWNEIETEPGLFDWAQVERLEAILKGAEPSEYKIILIVRGTPTWAQAVPGSFCGPISPEYLDSFAGFLQIVVERLHQPPYNIKYWELGNEPDVDPLGVRADSPFGCWGDLDDTEYYGGGYYAEMLKVAYPVIKAVDPEAQVLIGGLLLDCDPENPPEFPPGSGQIKDCTPARFLDGILSNGGGEYFDGVSYHAYDYYGGRLGQFSNINWHSSWDTTGPVSVAKSNYLSRLLQRYGYNNKVLMNTETALICGKDGSEPECQTQDYQQTKASYLTQSYVQASMQGLSANIWYSMRGWRGSGLVDTSWNPFPAYQTLQFQTRILGKAVYWSELQTLAGIRGFEFSYQGKYIWLLWSLDGLNHALKFSTMPLAAYDLYGNPLHIGPEFSITILPVYIVWETRPGQIYDP